MTRKPALATLAVTAALVTAVAGTSYGSAVAVKPRPGAASQGVAPAADRGAPGKWTKVSTGTVGTTFAPSLVRGSNGDLHVVYPRTVGDKTTIGHTAVHTNGSLGVQNTVLASPWVTMDTSPAVVSGPGGLSVLFGGVENSDNWAIHTATADALGSAWSLSGQNVGTTTADGSYGTAATTLADGSPVVVFPLNAQLFWHVGVNSNAYDSYTGTASSLYQASVVSDGSNAWAAWYQLGPTAGSTGIFVKQIYPTVGATQKAPGSSHGALMVQPDSRVALAARAGGGVFAAYCVGYPTCTAVRVWKVGGNKTADVPHSRFATSVAMSPGPSGRLWIAWSDNLPKVRAVRTNRTGLGMGAVQTPGLPRGGAVHSLAIDGTIGRGDIVINDGSGIWHTQVFAGLTLHASPKAWRHGGRHRVVFAVTDAKDPVKGAKVKVGAKHCTTRAKGTCSITFPPSLGKGKHTARATRSGYAPATAGLRVR